MIIDTYQSHIRRKGITREGGESNKNYELFNENCDLEGRSLDAFMLEKVFAANQAMGFCHVIIDSPLSDENIQSEYDRKEKGIRPYLIAYYPTQAINWKFSRGQFDWIMFKEYEYVGDDDPLNMKKAQEYVLRYKLWTTSYWAKFDKKMQLLAGGEDEGLHGWGKVPISTFYNRKSMLYELPIGLSAIKTIAEIDKKIFNLSSLLDEFLYRQCFVQIVMDKNMLGKIIETGTTRVLVQTDPEAKDPFFLEPPTGAAEFIVKERDRLIDTTYRFAMIRGDNYVEQNNPESGVAKAYDLHDTNQNIAAKSANMEYAENNLHNMLKDLHGEVKSQWPREFDIKTLNEELEEALNFMQADFGSVTYAREKAMRLIERDLQSAKPELIKKIQAEIEKVNPELDFDKRMRLLEKSLYDTIEFMQSIDPEAKPEDLKVKYEENVKRNQEKEGIKPEPTLQELIG